LYISLNERNGEKELSLQKVSERFMGLRAAMFTKCPGVRSFASNLGFTVFELDELSESGEPSDELLQLLGFSGGDVLDKCEFDLVFVHVLISEKPEGVDWLNELVGGIMQTALPGSCIASRLHFSIVLSYGAVSEGAEEFSLTMNSSKETDSSDLYLLRPRQSYTMRGGKILNDIRHHHPVLIAQWQEGVTRKDLAKTFSFNEFKEYGGNVAILADRFLHEVAFKLWKAPKYGA